MSPALYEQYLDAKTQNPALYARDLAAQLGVSEAELTHARVGHDARRLNNDTRALLGALEAVGEVKAITRNEYAVHEHLGRYQNQHLGGHAGLILNPRELDLRMFLNQWSSAFTLTENGRHGVRHSIQFFDPHGDAIHKIYATDQTDMAAWQALIDAYLSADNPPLTLSSAPEKNGGSGYDSAAIDTQWRAMTDVHQFFQLLRQHDVSRQQAFRAVGEDLAWQVSNDALNLLLQTAREEQNEIMVFVGNRGCVQIFTGQIARIAPHADWINIFNPRFTLHLREDQIAESWITRKPTSDGFVTSLELFAADGTQIAQLYGQRTEGEPEQTDWRRQVENLPRLNEAAA